MNFRVVLQNSQHRIRKTIQCPSNVGIWRFLIRYNLKGDVRPVKRPKKIDLTLDEDGYELSLREQEVLEEWCVSITPTLKGRACST
jgi:hypothetical protein